MKISSFDPKKHGFHFHNGFVSHPIPGLPIETRGLCGGMAMSALDYWRNGIAAPNHFAHDPFGNDFGGSDVPTEGSRLQSAIYERQVHSLTTSGVFFRWLFGPGSITDGYNASVGPEFTEIKRRIDAGRPCLVGLWGHDQGDVLGGHQVLCYGYETNPIGLWVYDPNSPDVESRLAPQSPQDGVQITGGPQSYRYRGWFCADVYNWQESPPWVPHYTDLVLTDGLRINGSGQAVVGRPLEVTATVTNRGQAPSRFKSLFIYTRDPMGRNIDNVFGGAEPGVTSLQPGESHTMTRRTPSFAAQGPGSYRIGASFLSLTDEWCDMALAPGTRHFIDVVAYGDRQLVADEMVEVREDCVSPVLTDVTLNAGDEFALTGSGSIWAGVWFTGNNGPEGWDRTTDNPRFPLHSRPDARQFSLIGAAGDAPWFYVGRGLSRRTYNGPSGQPLRLWVNDDVHANGTGAFQCRVQVWR